MGSKTTQTNAKLLNTIKPIGIVNPESKCNILLVCEHAGNFVPDGLNNLGLSSAALTRHIAWDIGALAVAKILAEHLSAELIYQKISRLVVDCNRPLSSDVIIPEYSEDTQVPGNIALSKEERDRRIQYVWQPFQEAIRASLDRREETAVSTILVSVHSFSAVYLGESRPWQVCLAYNHDDRLAKLLAEQLAREELPYKISFNQPYAVDDMLDQTIPVFGEGRNIPHVLIELRNDIVSNAENQGLLGKRIANSLQFAARRLEE